MELDEALDILADRLRTIPKLTVTTDPLAEVVVPMAVVTDTEMDYNQSMRRGDATLTFAVTVYVAQSDSPTGHQEARRYLSGHGDKSVREALDTPADDALLAKVAVDTGTRGDSGTYITAEFVGRSHIPGAVAN
jgi:hypothetical protein